MILTNIFKQLSAEEKQQRELNKKLISAISGSAAEVENLIEQGADPNATTSSGATVAATAVLYANSGNSVIPAAQEILQCLAEAGANMTQARETASAQSGHVLKSLLDQMATPQWWTDRLLDAARSGNASRVERILEQGVDPNTLNRDGVGALKELIDGYNKFVLWNGTLDTTLVRKTKADFLKSAQILVAGGADITGGGSSLAVRTLPNDALKSFLAAEWEQKVYPRPDPR